MLVITINNFCTNEKSYNGFAMIRSWKTPPLFPGETSREKSVNIIEISSTQRIALAKVSFLS